MSSIKSSKPGNVSLLLCHPFPHPCISHCSSPLFPLGIYVLWLKKETLVFSHRHHFPQSGSASQWLLDKTRRNGLLQTGKTFVVGSGVSENPGQDLCFGMKGWKQDGELGKEKDTGGFQSCPSRERGSAAESWGWRQLSDSVLSASAGRDRGSSTLGCIVGNGEQAWAWTGLLYTINLLSDFANWTRKLLKDSLDPKGA